MKLLWIVAGVALASGTAARAQDSTDEEARKSEKVVCKTKKITGSRTKVNRTCMTKREWDAMAQATRDGVDDLSRDANQVANERARSDAAQMAGAGAGSPF